MVKKIAARRELMGATVQTPMFLAVNEPGPLALSSCAAISIFYCGVLCSDGPIGRAFVPTVPSLVEYIYHSAPIAVGGIADDWRLEAKGT